MPCRSYEDDYWHDPAQKQIADKLAKLLCGTLTRLQAAEPALTYEELLEWPELREWWTEHQRADAAEQARLAKIKAENAAKKAALKKLTPAERKLLGVGK